MLDWLLGKKAPTIDERRKLVRRKLFVDVIAHLPVEGESDRDFRAAITDISVGGMKIRCFEPIPKGARLFVEYPEELQGVHWTRVQCRVQWVVKSKTTFETIAGLTYDEPQQNMATSWVKFLLEDVGFTADTLRERRQSVRVETDLHVQIHAHDKKSGIEMDASGKVTSLAPGGILVETMDPILEGREVQVVFTGQELKGLKLNGKVLNVQAQQSTRRFVHSISFQGATNAENKQIARFMQAELRKPRDLGRKIAKKKP